MKKYLLTDCDGVLLNWKDAFADWIGLEAEYDHDYDLSVCYNIPNWKMEVLMQTFERSKHFGYLEAVEPFALTALRTLLNDYKIVVISSVSADPSVVKNRAKNLIAVYGDIFEDIIHVGSDSKWETLSTFPPGSVWVEDNIKNYLMGEPLDFESFLYKRPWNRHQSIHPRYDWCDIYHKLRSK